MPRRKQGHIKETTGSNLRKKSDIGTKLTHNEAPKLFPIKNDLVFKIKKTLSSTTFSPTSNGKVQREYIEDAKSLNENNLMSKIEVNNNSITLADVQKLNMISKSENSSHVVNCKTTDHTNEVVTVDVNTKIDNVSKSSNSGKVGVVMCLSPMKEISTLQKFDEDSPDTIISEHGSNNVCENSGITCSKESSTVQLSTPKAIPVTSTAIVKKAHIKDLEFANSLTADEKRAENVEIPIESTTEKQEVDRNANQMSGVSPASPNIKNNSESHKFNYRLSTSINSTKPSPSNSSILKEEQNCQLPSSVYGTPASSIEKVLNGLQVPDKVIESASVSKISFLQEILEKDASERISYHVEQGQKENVGKGSPETNKISSKSASSDDCQKNILKNSDLDKNLVSETVIQPKLKLHIPEVISTDDSSSSVISSETQKVIKFPKITSPQILEQHISKIISENAAIVDTFDPLWPRRYLKVSNSQNLELEPRRQGCIIKSTHSNTLDSSNQSKLHSALLGGSENELNNSLNIVISSDFNSTSFSKTRPFSQFGNSSISKTSSSLSEEELQGSAIKSLLSLKQGRYSKLKNAFCFDNKDGYDQHPQNPEGSIIKDLLLKTKAKDSQRLSPDKESKNKSIFSASSFVLETTTCSSKAGSSQLTCLYCSTEFSDKYNLDTHISLCKNKDSLFSFGDSSKRTLSLPKTNAQTKMVSSDYRKISCLPTSKDNIQGEHKTNIDGGPILKKQLLLPLPSSPPVKRRKISEPVFTSNQMTEQQLINKKDFLKNISPQSSFDGIDISPHRSRSQSVHLFGGEVHILDGMKTKKMKIKTRIHGAFSSENYNFPFQKSSDAELDKDSNILPTVIVTIAQPVHNSGGTVTHVPNRKHSANLSAVVTLSNNVMSDSIIKYGKTEIKLNHNHKHTSDEVEFSKKLSSDPQVKESSSNNLPFVSYPYLPGPETKSLSSPSSLHHSPLSSLKEKDLKVASLSGDGSPMSFKLTLSPDHSNPFYSPIFLGSEKHGFDSTFSPSSISKEHRVTKDNLGISNRVVPTVLLTPSSPTVPPNEIEATSCSSSMSEPTKKFLAPTRPTSLPLKKKPFTMVGSTLISPETPRPKKSCVQLYLNGHAYTYLGLKCSTRSTYCCIYRPQPMFVLQETNPKLSMYSNWQVVPAKEELSGLTPGQMISFYSSKQSSEPKYCTTFAKLGEPLTFTHSSYWTYRSQDHETATESQDVDMPQDSRADNETIAHESAFYGDKTKDNADSCNTIAGHLLSNETVIAPSTIIPDSQVHSTDESSQKLDTDNTLSSDLDANASNDEDDDDDEDCQDDGTESLTDSSQPQPPKRVKIFEGGFKSNEDYTYVRGRGRGKYVCEECGIRCKKPSMLKKHIRTHTDLRPYKCRHCSFAFKTKGNLTKHMKSKAHHKKCTELGIIPVPTTTDDSQIDEEALAKQIEKKKSQLSDGEDADDDEDDTDESDDDCESDTSMMASNPKPKTIINGHPKNSESNENTPSEILDESFQEKYESSQNTVEQEAARSLLHLFALGEPSQWSTSTGDLTDIASCETDTGSQISNQHEQTLPQYQSPTVSTIVLPSSSSKIATDQATLSWIPTENLGHRPRSYSADVPSSGGKELLARYRLTKNTTVDTACSTSTEDAEFASREPYTRRYSISVAREARKPRILQPPEWDSSGLLATRWPDLESSDQPMDLSISRDLGRSTGVYGHGISLLSAITQEETGLDTTLPIHLDTCISESYPKSLPVLSPHAITEYEAGAENSNTDATLLQSAEESAFSNNQNRSVFYMPNISAAEGSTSRKETDVTDDPPSPDMSDYAVCSPVSPPATEDGAYYYGQESLGQASSTPEEIPPSSRFHAEFIVPSTSSSMEDGKCVCRICNKIFAKSSHLRLHVNIHYFERPFRCDNCAVSFRTKGHLQKHKRSVSHYNKVNMNLTFGTPTVDNPRPFKCADCKIAFRIHGHLAKHLRSKMHIMKLECLGKLPFGMYAEMERSGVSLNEIDTTDCNNSLESLQVMAQKLYQRDPRRMRWQGPEHISTEVDQATKSVPTTMPIVEPTIPDTESSASAFNLPCTVVGLPIQSTATSKTVSDTEEVKQEPSEMEAYRTTSVSNKEGTVSPLSQYLITQPQSASNQAAARKNDGPEHDSAISLRRSGTCHICGRLFKSAKFLQVHLYCDHPTWNPSSVNDVTSSNTSSAVNTIQELACDLCGKNFPNQKTLQQHLLSHAQPRPFVCEVCDAGFTSSASLTTHKSTHQTSSTSAASESRLVQLQ